MEKEVDVINHHQQHLEKFISYTSHSEMFVYNTGVIDIILNIK